MKIPKETRAGFFMLIALIMLIWGINFLKGKRFFRNDYQFFAVYPEVSGLSESAPVVINGLKVGNISEIHLMQDFNNQLLVTLEINKKYRIPVNTKAQIKSSSNILSKEINLIFPKQSNNYHKSGDTLQALYDKGVTSLLDKLENTTDQLTLSVDSVLLAIIEILNKENRQLLTASLKNIENITSNLNNHLAIGGSLDATLNNFESISSNLNTTKEKIELLLDNMVQFSDTINTVDFNELAQSIEKMIQEINFLVDNINSGQGTLGQLVTNDTLYSYIQSATNNLDSLLLDLRKNPHQYVNFSLFGKNKDN